MLKRKLVWVASPFVFERATRGSYRKGNDITMHVNAALAGPIGIPTLHTYYLTYHNAYLVAYNDWTSHMSSQTTSTTKLVSRLKDLIVSAKAWDLAIQHVYSEDTPEYQQLLPHGRKPFYTGSQTDKITAVQALSTRIGTDPLLAAVKSGVDNFHQALLADFNAQKGEATQTKGYSDALETARLSMCTGLQYVKAMLEVHYVDNPDMVLKYFPMYLIQQKKQKEFTGRVPPQTTKDIVKRGYTATSMVGIENNGLSNLEFYLCDNKQGILPPGTIPLIVPPNTKEQVAASQLGNLDNPYLIVRNPSALVEGEYIVVTE